MNGTFKKNNPCPYGVRSCAGRGIDGCDHGTPGFNLDSWMLKAGPVYWLRMAEFYKASVRGWKSKYLETREPGALFYACQQESRRVMLLRLVEVGKAIQVNR